jgi:N utilization substance protein A
MEQKQLSLAIEQICEEKGISREVVLETIEMALASAYKKEYGRKGQNIRAEFDIETGDIKIFQIKTVVSDELAEKGEIIIKEPEIEKSEEGKKSKDTTDKKSASDNKKDKKSKDNKEESGESYERKIKFNPEKHIALEEAKKIKKKFDIDDEVKLPLEIEHDFGRIAAQTAKQVIIQRIKEAEKNAIFDEYQNKEGEVMSGVVQRVEGETVFVDIGRAVGLLFEKEKIPTENYRIGQRMKVYIQRIEKGPKGPVIVLSRRASEMIKRLFELEVPEVFSGSVEIKSVAREAGSRAKVAVTSKEEGIDPIGSCIGQRGTRVQTVINELAGEKIDVIEWNKDPVKFIKNAIMPAKADLVLINEKDNTAVVQVPEDQLSLAIGKKGQNVRLAVKLTGWKIDVMASESLEKEKPAHIAAQSMAGEEEKPKEKPEEKLVEDKESEKKSVDVSVENADDKKSVDAETEKDEKKKSADASAEAMADKGKEKKKVKKESKTKKKVKVKKKKE